MPVFTVKNINESIDFVNKLDKPLAVYYFGKNSFRNKNMVAVKERTTSGAFLVNERSLFPPNNLYFKLFL